MVAVGKRRRCRRERRDDGETVECEGAVGSAGAELGGVGIGVAEAWYVFLDLRYGIGVGWVGSLRWR